MITTVFLASMWGPAILAMGLGMMLNKAYFVKIYRGIQEEKLAVLVAGLAAIAAGAAHVQAHNFWQSFPEIVVSLLGWGLLIKGFALSVFPKLSDKGGDFAADSKIVPSAGIVMLILGAYLTWFAYFV